MAKSRRKNRPSAQRHSSDRDRIIGEIRGTIARSKAGRFGSKDVSYGINRYREALRIADVPRSIAVLGSHPAYKTVVWPKPFPTGWHDFATGGFNTYRDLEFELSWVAHALLLHQDAINSFLEAKRNFDRAILISDFGEAEKSLESVEQRFGFSVWLAEARIALFQRTSGFKTQREFIRRVNNETKSTLVSFLITWIGFKHEENTSYSQFTRILERSANKDLSYHFILRLTLGDFVPLSTTQAARTLSHADTLPVIDRYLLLLKVVQAVLAHSADNPDILALIQRSTSGLAGAVNDAPLRRAYFAAGGEAAIGQVRRSFSDALDAYTGGAYYESQSICQKDLKTFPESIANVDLLQRSINSTGASPEADEASETLQSEIGMALSEIIHLGPKAIERRQRLQKIGLVYSNCGWAPGIQMLVPPIPSSREPINDKTLARYVALRSDEDHPSLVGRLRPLISAERYLSAIAPGPSLTSSLMLLTYAGDALQPDGIDDLPIPPNRRARFQAIALMERGETAAAIPIFRTLFEGATTSLDRLEAGPLLVTSLLLENELGAAAEVAARLLLSSPYFASILPLAALVSAIVEAQEAGDPKGARGQLSIATVADMYARYIAPDQESARSDAYKDFLRANGVKRPSELADRLGDFPKDEIIYFLRYVCVPEVLDQSLALPTTTAVEDERVAALLMLSELTPEEDRELHLAYLEEVREIRTRQVVRDTNKRLEQSKIFVNVEGIKKRVDASIQESWDRYRVLSIQGDESDVYTTVSKMLEKQSGGKVVAVPLSLPETERSKLFQQMVTEIRDLFVDSKEFGLDANLSANIRHGYVLRELRSPLLAQNLVTNRPSLDEPYQENSYWANRLTDLTPDEHAAVQGALALFSADIDQRIEDLNINKLRVHSQSVPDGMFVYQLNAPQIGLILQKIDKDDSHEAFIQAVIDHFWKATQYNLERVRQYLEGAALQGFGDALDSLERTLDTIARASKLTALRSAITLSRPEVQAAVGRVASWFTLSTEIDYPDYTAETAYQAGIETIKSYAANTRIESSLECEDEIVLRGRTLPFIGRIMFIILDNAVEHSRVGEDVLKIHCSIGLSNDFLVFRITSGLGPAVDLEHVSQSARDVNDLYGTEKATQFISVERRSGYPKIWKILTHDLQVEHLLEVGVNVESREFTVEIMMAAGRIVR